MDRTGLTPYLRRRIFALPLEGRLALIAELNASLGGQSNPRERLAWMQAEMESLVGFPLADTARDKQRVRARSVFAYCARKDGFTTTEIGRALGHDHSSVVVMCQRMESAFAQPSMYSDYIQLLEAYSKKILK